MFTYLGQRVDLVEGVSELLVRPSGRGLVSALLDAVPGVQEDGEDVGGHDGAGGGQFHNEGGLQQARKGLVLVVEGSSHARK